VTHNWQLVGLSSGAYCLWHLQGLLYCPGSLQVPSKQYSQAVLHPRSIVRDMPYNCQMWIHLAWGLQSGIGKACVSHTNVETLHIMAHRSIPL
jgi:hypothetical protein